LQKGEQEFVYLEVHFPFWVQVCARIYIVCGKITKTEYCFQLKVTEQVDTAALMRFNFIGLESRGIRNPATKYIEASELDPNHVTFFHDRLPGHHLQTEFPTMAIQERVRSASERESKLHPDSCNLSRHSRKSKWKLERQRHPGLINTLKT